jgi:hypothetical protein
MASAKWNFDRGRLNRCILIVFVGLCECEIQCWAILDSPEKCGLQEVQLTISDERVVLRGFNKQSLIVLPGYATSFISDWIEINLPVSMQMLPEKGASN